MKRSIRPLSPALSCSFRSLTRVSWFTWALLLLAAFAQPGMAQMPVLEHPKDAAPLEHPEDLLGRTTPRGTFAAFIRAVDRDDIVAAARYMQVTKSQRGKTETLARDLKALVDRYFNHPITTISDSPAGALDDGLPMDRDRVGPLEVGDDTLEVILVQVSDPEAGSIWLISSETLAQVPALQGSSNRTRIERMFPQSVANRKLFGVSLAYWIVLAASLAIPFLILTLVSGALIALVRVLRRNSIHRREVEDWYAGLRWPAVATLALAIQLLATPALGFELTFRMAYARVGLVLFVIVLTWLLRRLLTLGFARARGFVWGKNRTSTQSLMILAERVIKAVLAVVAVIAILVIVGVDTKATLAGVGIGGVALALGAQKTVENFLGGVFLLSDRVLAVGDFCSISNRLGWVEDITLRSVRLRTVDQTLVSVPAGVLAQTGIENFASRTKILVQTTLPLRYDTSAGQIRSILEGIRARLDANSKIETGTSSIRLVKFGERAIELELFAYVLTVDGTEFLAVREGLLLEAAEIVERAGSAFAQPTQVLELDGREKIAR